MRVGVLGAGRMGLPIARRLGTQFPVSGFDIAPARLEDLRANRIDVAPDMASLARSVDVLTCVLPGATEQRAALLDPDLLRALRPGAVVLDLTSGDPRTADEFVRSLPDGVGYVAAPMSGDPSNAAVGSLTFYIAGAPHDVTTVRPVLRPLAGAESRLRLVGEHARVAVTTKLLINALWFAQALLVSEVLQIARADGLPDSMFAQILHGGPSDSTFIRDYLPAIIAGDYVESFGIDRVVEELDSVLALGRDHGIAPGGLAVVRDRHDEALALYGPVPGELLVARLLLEGVPQSLATNPGSLIGTDDDVAHGATEGDE